MHGYIQKESDQNFIKICERTQAKFEEEDDTNVTVQTSFVCLLHLANENGKKSLV